MRNAEIASAFDRIADAAAAHLAAYPGTSRVLAEGATKDPFVVGMGSEERQVDLRISPS